MSLSFSGIVQKGEERGKALGFPTINIPLADDSVSGIYAARVSVKGSEYVAAAYVDTRRKLLEAHLLHFEDDLYGLPVTITLVHKIRDAQRFDTEDELKRAITADVKAVRAYFA